MNKRIFTILVFVVSFFVLETTISFSDRGDVMQYKSVEDSVSFLRKLNNNLSDLDEMAGFERAFTSFLDRWHIKGASVAIAKEGKMIYAKGFGYANAETGEKVQPYHQFRVASVSKLITSIAIMKLVEDGKISLNDKVFGKEGILKRTAYWKIYDDKVKKITVKHLLEHSAGWDLWKGDPMFMPITISRFMKTKAPPDVETVMRYVLGNRRLDFEPGARSSYSNFGYAVLGKVIEAASGSSYESYVQENILHPLGIYNMALGKSLFYEKQPNEVKYYEANKPGKRYSCFATGRKVQRQYGGNSIELLSSAGGWIAAPAELLKLVLAVDNDPRNPDILSGKTITTMTYPYRSGKDPIGWKGTNAKGLWWRTGSFAGTSALVMKRPDGTVFAVLLNTSTWKGSYFPVNVYRAMLRGMNRIDEWPKQDLFVFDHPSSVHLY